MKIFARQKKLLSVVLAMLVSAGISLSTTPAPAAAAPATFTHPGVLVSRAQLDFVKAKVNTGQQPWLSAYNQMIGSTYASLDRAPHPRSVVECGPYSNPNLGCTDERQDAIAAYTLALRWYITGDSRYATKAISIMDAWSNTITDHTNSNAPLQTAWAAATWAPAAEIIRYTYSSWPNAGRFGTMLRSVYLPEIVNGNARSNGNWELVMMESTLGISIFLEDRATYDKAVAKYRTRVPAFVYLKSDGALPKPPPNSGIDTQSEIISYWHGQSNFFESGITQETCRDFTHTGYGIASIADFAETTRIQGQDIYPEIADRLRTALGFQARYELGTAPPSHLCGGTVNRGLGPVTEVGYNHLHTRLGITMPNTQTLTESRRPAGTNSLFVAWQTLTHANNPN